ncbi:MAG TPA: DUF2510 domain-containing protein [Actinomycetota bacterium]|nr:DUF2510 domain-containing protein [Actinomycetota bacterium]
MATAAEGWYPDPVRTHLLRWYGGGAWTEHVFDGFRRRSDPAGSPLGEYPAPAGDDVWLPPPGLPDTKRWGPFAVGVPTGGPAGVPVGGYEPVLTGNRALDLTQNYVNEFESQLRRDASLLASSWTAMRSARGLRTIGVVLAVVALAAFVALGGAVYAAWDAEASPFGFFFLVLALVALVLPAIYVVPNVVAFGAAVAAGLAAGSGQRTSAPRLLRDAWRARGPLGALALARIAWWAPGLSAKGGAALYEAFAVLAVPAALDAGLGLRAAQRRSEELVSERWGPGRFRALGLPQTNPWSIVYSRGVTRYGYKAPYLAAAAFVGALLGPLLVALAVGDTTWILAAFAWMWGSVAIGGLLWWSTIQPLLQGLLRAHLYLYAKTGDARPPYDADALHACLREEARASFGLPQRRGGRRSPLGVGGVVRSFASDPSGYVQSEAGLTPGDVKGVIAGARQLYRDGKLVTAALKRSREGLDAAGLLAATGLPHDRCRTVVANLVWSGKVNADVSPAGEARFSLAG